MRKWWKLGLMSANQQNNSLHCNMHMLSVLKVSPGSIMADILSPSIRLAANMATKWSRLEVLVDPSVWHTHICSGPMLDDSSGNFACHPWLLRYHYPLARVSLDYKQSKGLSVSSYQIPITSPTSLLKKGYPSLSTLGTAQEWTRDDPEVQSVGSVPLLMI